MLSSEIPQKVSGRCSVAVELCANAGAQNSSKGKSKSCFIFLITCFWVEYYNNEGVAGLGILGELGTLEKL